MDQGDVHVGRGDRGGQRFVAVADQQNDVGLEPVELAGKLDQTEPDALGHGRWRRAFQFDVDFAVDVEAVAADDVHRLVEPFEDHGPRGQHLQLQGRLLLDGGHYRFQPAVVGPVDEHHANFSSSFFSQDSSPPKTCWL